jgi:hypothetical protein
LDTALELLEFRGPHLILDLLSYWGRPRCKLLVFVSEHWYDDVGTIGERVAVDHDSEKQNLVTQLKIFRAQSILSAAHAHTDVVAAHSVLDLGELLGKTFLGLESRGVKHEIHASDQVEFVLWPQDVLGKAIDVD